MPDFFFSHVGKHLEIKRNLKELVSKKGPKKKKNVPQNVAQASQLQKSDASNLLRQLKGLEIRNVSIKMFKLI